jgi:hypothetical protein
MRLFILIFLVFGMLILSPLAWAQKEDDLEALLDNNQKPSKEYVTGTFKGTRVINLHSVEKVAPGALQFLIQHRFGAFNGGAYQFYGLDQATIRLGLEYGINKFLCVGIGRSSYNKNVDGYVKASIVRQSTGTGSFPISILYFGSVAINGMHFQDETRDNYFSSRMAFTHQLIFGSKISKDFSFQVSPTFIHRNLVTAANDPNDMFAVGFGTRYRLSKRISLNLEYIYRVPPKDKTAPSYANFYNSMSAGFDIETGGHVFQLHLTNSLPMYEVAFITETAETWRNGGVHLGFNISRDFVLKKKKSIVDEDISSKVGKKPINKKAPPLKKKKKKKKSKKKK